MVLPWKKEEDIEKVYICTYSFVQMKHRKNNRETKATIDKWEKGGKRGDGSSQDEEEVHF